MNYVWNQSRYSFAWAVFSFGVTITRLFMAVFAFFNLLDAGTTSSHFLIITITAIVLLDHIDGRLFEKTFLSDFEIWKNRRRVFDSICDRLCIQLFCIPILILQPQFIAIYTIVLFKEFLTAINCIKAYNKNIVLSSNTAGKVSCIAIGFTVIMWLLQQYLIAYCLAPIILITGYISCTEYYYSYKKYL